MWAAVVAEIIDSQLSIAFCEIPYDLHDMCLTLLCLNFSASAVCQNSKLSTNVHFLYPQNFQSKSIKTPVSGHD